MLPECCPKDRVPKNLSELEPHIRGAPLWSGWAGEHEAAGQAGLPPPLRRTAACTPSLTRNTLGEVAATDVGPWMR